MLFSPQALRRLAIYLFIPIPILVFALVLGLLWRSGILFNVTGEERFSAQLKGLSDLTADWLRPDLNLAGHQPAKHSGINPFGVNVFLEQEPDPAVRARTVRFAAQAGFHWLRQEFPWEDIEIHGKGDFQDRRHEPARSAWEKYDQIVSLAEAEGLELIVRISNPPAWSRTGGNDVGPYAPPDNYQDYADFVRAVVDRYQGRVSYYQLWNEPNIYPEWGDYSISPEAYTELLCMAAEAARTVDPNVVIINGALASTIVLNPDASPPGNALNDFLFLQRMYDAGAAPCFDIVAMQGYGLWSGPSDRRMNPRVINFSRPLFMRDLMVANGDAHKPIWISEMNWNAVPDQVADKRFGQVTESQQAAYLPLAYQRIQEEWPWLGVANTWFLKRPDDRWREEAKPEAYFRLLEPDFTPLPVYESFAAYAGTVNANPIMYPGAHPPSHRAVKSDVYEIRAHEAATLGEMGVLEDGGRIDLSFLGTSLRMYPHENTPDAYLSVSVDDARPRRYQVEGGKEIRIGSTGDQVHRVSIVTEGDLWVDYWFVRADRASRWFWPLVCLGGVLIALLMAGLAVVLVRRTSAPSTPD